MALETLRRSANREVRPPLHRLGHPAPSTERPADAAAPGWVTEILALQRTAGNAAVTELLAPENGARGHEVQRKPATATAPTPVETHPGWTSDELGTIQRELRRLGLYTMAVDKVYGQGTRSGLVEAFGGEEWLHLTPDLIIDRLKAAKPPSGKAGELRFRYGEMFKDGILDITLGVGFDETKAHVREIDAIKAGLKARSFVDNHVMASLLLMQAHRPVGLDAFGEFWVKLNAISYAPPAGPPRPINAVIRLVYSLTGKDGDKAAAAFQEGMIQSDVSFYAGHARLGSGPDFSGVFDRAEVFNAAGQSVKRIEDYELLQTYLESPPPDGGRRHGLGAWGEFNAYNPVLARGGNLSDEARRKHHLMVVPSPDAHLFLNPVMIRRSEAGFERHLIYWILQKSGAKPITGKKGALAHAAAAQPDRKYRVVVFNACTTEDYQHSVQGTPGLDPRSADIMMSRRPTYWEHYAEGLLAFLDSLIVQQSAEQIVQAVNKAEPYDEDKKARSAFGKPSGMGLDPVIK